MGQLCPDVESTWLSLRFMFDQMHCAGKESMVLVPPNSHAPIVYADSRVNKLQYSVKQSGNVEWLNTINELPGIILVLMCVTGHMLEAFGFFVVLFTLTTLLLLKHKNAYRHRMFCLFGALSNILFTVTLTGGAAPMWYLLVELWLSYRRISGFVRGASKIKQNQK